MANEVQTQTGHCEMHGTVEATREAVSSSTVTSSAGGGLCGTNHRAGTSQG
jgi:hypothetical protein